MRRSGFSKLLGRIRGAAKDAVDPDHRRRRREERLLAALPPFERGSIPFRGGVLHVIDAQTVPFLVDEILDREVYRFSCDSPEPYILDCGANIGISVLYFKRLFPDEEVTAFEPDPKVFEVLQANADSFNLLRVKLLNLALWKESGPIQFDPDPGSTAGRVAVDSANLPRETVQATSLRPYLERRVDFLKMDIEGAEYQVLASCQDLLRNVDRIFVEYHSYVDQEQDLPALLQILRDSGFRIFIESPSVIVKRPFLTQGSYKSMDMMLNISGIREIRR